MTTVQQAGESPTIVQVAVNPEAQIGEPLHSQLATVLPFTVIHFGTHPEELEDEEDPPLEVGPGGLQLGSLPLHINDALQQLGVSPSLLQNGANPGSQLTAVLPEQPQFAAGTPFTIIQLGTQPEEDDDDVLPEEV